MIRGSTQSTKAAIAFAGLAGVVVLTFGLVVLRLTPEMVLAVVAAGIVIPFLVMRPDIGVMIFVATIYIENVLYLNQNATAMKFAGGLILLGWLLSVGVNRRVNLRLGPVIVLMMLFVGWNALTILYAIDADSSLAAVATYLQLGVAMCMVGSVVDSAEKVRGVFRTIVLCTTVAAAHGTVLYLMGINITSAGVVLNRNAMAAYIDFAIVLAYFLYQMTASALERMWLLVSLPILFLGLALTFSRTGYIAVLVVFVLISYRLAKGRGYVLLGATMTMLVVLAALLPAAFYKRVGSIVPSMQHQEETFGVRVDLWKAGLRMIREDPITGVGPGNFGKALSRHGYEIEVRGNELASHNTYVGVAAEAGIPALLLFLLLCGAGIRDAVIAARVMRRGGVTIGLQALAVETCIVVTLTTALTGNAERQKFLYVFFGLAVSLRRLSEVVPAAADSRMEGLQAQGGEAPAYQVARIS